MTRINSFRDLTVWQRGMDVVVAVYRLTEGFPKSELYGLTSQLRRAAVSVPSNIAERHTRESTKEYLNHISVAQGSVAEILTQVEIASRLGYIGPEQKKVLIDEASVLAKQLHSLRYALRKRV
jgi:four helix bundle protein